MKLFNKVTIIGVGLIGGSIGLAIRRRKLAREVTGVFRRRATLIRALKRGAVSRGFMNVADGVRGADLIIVASPVHSIPRLVREAAKSAERGAIITDVGSTKRWIVDSVGKVATKARKIYFVGSHPMAGSEHTGVRYARCDLLDGAACIVTRTRSTDKDALKRVVAFWKALGGRVSVMDPAAHDSSVANISHLPHVVAFGLAGAVSGKDLRYAAEGFKDTTRVASSDPDLWADIFLTNRREVAKSGVMFTRYLNKILNAVAADDRKALVRMLVSAKSKRDRCIDEKKA